MMKIWGFDLGVTSIGFACVQLEPNLPDPQGSIEQLGVRIFPESREKGEKTLPPKNLARRSARLIRRQIRRRRWRRVHLRQCLAEAGLIPSADARPAAGQDPYILRRRGLVEPLDKQELGWALFHLLKRRGFAGSRKRGEPKDARATKDEQDAEQAIQSLAAKLNGQLLSQYLAAIETSIETPRRRRAQGQARWMITDELTALWAAQAPYHPAHLTEPMRARIEQICLAQRPTYFRRRTIGQCELEPAEPRALKAEWLAQHVETLQLVNALRLEAGNQRSLDPTERATALEYLQSTQGPSWAGLKRAAGLAKDCRFTHEKGKKAPRGNATEAALRKACGPEFPNHPQADQIRAAIAAAWHFLEYRPARGGSILEIRDFAGISEQRQRLAERAARDWQLAPEAAARLAEIDLPDGHANHSLRAMRRLRPHLEAGDPYMTALQREYSLRPSAEPLRLLPGPNMSEVKRLTDPAVRERMETLLSGIRNPTVLRTLGELQKVVNTLIRVRGKPDLIRIEMARDLKMSPAERLDMQNRQNDRAKLREAARDKLRQMNRAADGKEGEQNILRLLLWQEQGGRCPYTGGMIGCADALSAAATEINHIFPLPRSFDDSQANKVVCMIDANRRKGGRTPFEFLAGDAAHWDYLNETVWPQMKGAGWPFGKLSRCRRQNFEEAGDESFTARQLVDTAYIARVARDYLGLLFGGGQEGANAVQAVPGRATAALRRAWKIGLGRLLHGQAEDAAKIRDDHRHHAVDALAVALTDPGTVSRLSRWWQVRLTGAVQPDFPPPFADFHAQTRRAVEAIVVSHRVQAKLSGPLHEETRLGDTGRTDGKYKLFVKRKPLAGLTAGDIENIRDQAVKNAIKGAVAAAGSLKRAVAGEIRLPRKDGSPGPVIRRVRLYVKRSEGVMRTHAAKNTYAELGPGTNDRIVLYRNGDNVHFRVFTKRETASLLRSRSEEDQQEEYTKPIMTLRANDVLERDTEKTVEYVLVRKFYGNGQIFFKPLTLAVEPETDRSMRPGPLIAAGWRKVSVSPIGRVSSAT